MSVTKILDIWHDSFDFCEEIPSTKHLTAVIYYLACRVYASKLIDRSATGAMPEICSLVERAVKILKDYPLDLPTPITSSWPLLILSLGATDKEYRNILRAPLLRLIDISGFVGYGRLLEFLDIAWGGGPSSASYLGLDALFRDDLLSLIHL